jgi:addiction module HigA family antidote
MTIRSPGEIISSDILPHMNVRPSELAVAMGMSHASISRILTGKAAITPETAIRLEKVLNEKADFWMSLQTSYDLARAKTTVDVTSLAQLEAKPGLHSARALLKNIFERYVGTDRRSPLTDLVEVTELCGVEPLFMLMRQVDPERKLFDYPLGESDRGIHGLPLLDTHFKLFRKGESSDYAFPDEPNEFSRKFLKAAGKLFKSEKLNGHAHPLATWSLAFNVEGLLLTIWMRKTCVPVSQDILELEEKIKVPVVCYARGKDFRMGECLCLTAFVTDIERINPDDINAISEELKGLAEKWVA